VANWKINCMENEYPGLWHTWFREQIVGVGWPPDNFGLQTPTNVRAWSDARRCLMQINPGDRVIVQLRNWRVGRIGMVLSKEIDDEDWNPSVPPQGGDMGEMGRRVQVRWDLTTGPLTPSFVVRLFSLDSPGYEGCDCRVPGGRPTDYRLLRVQSGVLVSGAAYGLSLH
jgi:hypothetical protein